MAKNISIYDPRTMLAAIETMMPTRTFLKDMFFPKPETFVTEAVDVDYYKGKRKMAPFVSPRLPGQVIEREGFTTQTYKPALVKPKTILTVGDLQTRSMGENIYSGKSPDDRAIELLANDLEKLDSAVTRREEWLAAQILFTGKADMVGEGVNQTIDFSFTNKVVLAGTDKWNDPSSDPIAKLEALRLEVIKTSGVTPDVGILASDVVPFFRNNPIVQKLYDNRGFNIGRIDPKTLPNGATYIGTIVSLGLDLFSYDEWYLDDETDPLNPVEKPMVPSGTVMIGSTRSRSSMLYGAVTLAVDNQFVTYEGPRIPDSWMQKDPAARFAQLHSRPLPVPHEVNSWYIAKVF
ncbi:major capsid protein [Paenibacillus anseongense]|uniref:major capsid protein n=1 Tax=Paenibacillus anseongense TaxID=2682845 RepID=UPI002DB8695E|nr:major capsid protein [Paenibacillus anseongense]MEC0269065.1 major capsid protein [Paenibacillus anseongense]